MYRPNAKKLATSAMHWMRNHWPIFASLAVSLVVLGPLLRPGYILSYDMVFSPHVSLALQSTAQGYSLYNALPIQATLKLLSFIVPMDFVEKLILAAIFFLAIYGIYRLLPLRSSVARFLAGLLYGLNPFVYDRLMAGHWQFLLAYALTPFALKAFWNVFEKPNKRSVLHAAAIWAGIAVINSHHLVILGLLFLASAVTLVRSHRTFLAAVATIGGYFIASSWWLLPLIFIPNTTHEFGLGDFQTFTAKPDTIYGIWPTLLSLQGFWFHDWRPFGEFVKPWAWLLVVWLAPALTGIGSMATRRADERRKIISLGIAAVTALLFVAGPSAGFGNITTWLFLHVPGLSGLREPQKLIALVALFYAVATGYGLDLLLKSRRIVALTTSFAASVIIIVFGWPILWGAHGQLTLSHYPESWRALSAQLDRQPDSRVLVLPYDLYMNKTFAGRLVADPALVYFGDRAIASNNPELPNVHTFQTADDRVLAQIIAARDSVSLQKLLDRLHVHYIILIKSDNSDTYLWITTLPHSVIYTDDKNTILTLTSQ